MTKPDHLRRRWRVLLAGLGVLISLADRAEALSVSPSRVVLRAKPKQTQVVFFTVQNEGGVPVEVRVEPEDWAQGIASARGQTAWLTVQPTRVLLKPGNASRVKCTVRTPQEASGELRAQLFFTTETGAGSSTMRSRLGAILYVAIQGTERLDAAITRVSAHYTPSTPGVERPDRLDVMLAIHNRSNAHIIPGGQVTVRDEAGQKVATVPLQKGWGLLPNEEDAYHAIGPGIYLKPGRYTLDIRVEYGEDLQQPMAVTKTVPVTINAQGQLQLLAEGGP